LQNVDFENLEGAIIMQ